MDFHLRVKILANITVIFYQKNLFLLKKPKTITNIKFVKTWDEYVHRRLRKQWLCKELPISGKWCARACSRCVGNTCTSCTLAWLQTKTKQTSENKLCMPLNRQGMVFSWNTYHI